jgi:hypothetical protein
MRFFDSLSPSPVSLETPDGKAIPRVTLRLAGLAVGTAQLATRGVNILALFGAQGCLDAPGGEKITKVSRPL